MEQANITDYEIQRLLERLDNVSVKFEAEWGVGNLVDMVDADLRQKWSTQWDKLNAGVDARDLNLVRDLTEGCIRGWSVLAANATKNGHKPITDECWTIAHRASGRVYRICKTNLETFTKVKDVVSYSLDEVVNILESQQLVNVDANRPALPKSQRLKFDFTRGDEIVW